MRNSRNGTFLFLRDYMDYHADRFDDCSFLFQKKGKFEAVIPGNHCNNTLYSHQGLTYGGVVSSTRITTTDILEIFALLNGELKKMQVTEVRYKPVPVIYHRIPAQEDIYALFLLNAVKTGCCISSTIFQSDKIKFTESRKGGVRKSLRSSVEIAESHDLATFWKILEQNLAHKFHRYPVHSLPEIEHLKTRFPDNIRFYGAWHAGTMVAGTVLYVMKHIIHVQYISANETGKKLGALDLLFDILVNREFLHVPVFDFGTSNGDTGNILNENLLFQKEGFGGRCIVHEQYQYEIL
ncbi:MAG: GNAT family N-acetyltransferase [Bacteroidota bacterium]